MNLPVILSPVADQDLDAAASWYEQQARLGETFVERAQQAVDQIGQMPELHAVIYRGIRRVQIPRFPYNMFYRIEVDRIEVIAVLHARRNPSIWRSRA